MNATQVCFSVPGRPYTTPAPTTLAPTIPITAAPVPTDIADGINQYCGRYYQAKLGDYCNMIVIKFGISLDDFVFLNPVINANCTNLFAEESYCVQAVGDSVLPSPRLYTLDTDSSVKSIRTAAIPALAAQLQSHLQT
jgi:hypothetical protein